MKTITNLLAVALVVILFTSCYTEVIVDDDFVEVNPGPSLNQVLNQYELWYIDIDRSSGNAVVPFLQKAFTISFRNGTLFANNNLSGIGDIGGGFGIDVAGYSTFNNFELDVAHDIDGSYSFDVRRLSKSLELGKRYIQVM